MNNIIRDYELKDFILRNNKVAQYKILIPQLPNRDGEESGNE